LHFCDLTSKLLTFGFHFYNLTSYF